VSQENVEVLRVAFAEMADGDAMAVLRVSDENVRLYPRPEEPGVRPVYEGWEGCMEYFSNWYGQWDAYEISPVEFLDAGDHVVVVLHERGRLERSEIEIKQDFSHSFKLRDRRIIEWRMYDNHDQALDAVGLREG
jgi:ketosteroid isomerase-like protein